MSVDSDNLLKQNVGSFVDLVMSEHPVRIRLLEGYDEVDINFPKGSPLVGDPNGVTIRVKSDEALECVDVDIIHN